VKKGKKSGSSPLAGFKKGKKKKKVKVWPLYGTGVRSSRGILECTVRETGGGNLKRRTGLSSSKGRVKKKKKGSSSHTRKE